MGFALHINYILRQDIEGELVEGETRKFSKNEATVLVDQIPIWLTKKDWTPVADIQISFQTREGDITTGEYKVLHVYEAGGAEQTMVRDMFRRMYGWK